MKNQLKPMFRSFFFTLILLGLGAGAFAQNAYTVQTVPDPKAIGNGYISDPDNVIPANFENQLNSLISGLEDSTTAQVAVVVVNSIGDRNPKDFATALFREWGIGQAGKDNGLLILTVMDQRRTEFETGYGLEGVLPDAICYRIGMQELVPYFKNEQYGEGLVAAMTAFKERLEDPEAASEISADRPGPVGSGSGGLSFRYILLVIYLLLAGGFHIHWLTQIRNVLQSKEELYDRYMATRNTRQLWACFVFPIPYLLVYFFLTRKMKALRTAPRYSRETGVPMHLLDEEADDEFLTDGQIMEEQLGSVDYDVWKPEDDSDLLILRYDNRYSKYKKCPSCKFRAYYHARTQIVRHATYSSSGKKRLVWECKNCRYEKQTYKIIPKKTRSSSSSGSSGGGGGSWGGGSSGGGGAGVSW
jgi:uncharacterized protein